MLLLLFISLSLAERYGLDEHCPDHTLPEKSGRNIKLCGRDKDCSKGYKCTSTIQKHFGASIKYCCQTRESICSLPPNPGYGDCLVVMTTKYYFDTFELRCKPFKHFPCKGVNQNQFDSFQECSRFCQSTACSGGESLLISPSNKPVTCANSDACPEGYKCVFDSLFRRHVCCGKTRQGSCPLGTLAYASPRNYLPLQCDYSPVGDNCPHDFLCTGHGHQSFCCTPEYGICTLGQEPYEHPITGRSMKCDPMRPVSECPSDFSCTSAVPGASWGFCCSLEIRAQCPSGTKPYLEPITHHPVKCTVGVSMCGIGFACQSLSGSIIGFCCTRPKKGAKLSELEAFQDRNQPYGPQPHDFLSDSGKKSIDLELEFQEEPVTTTTKRTISTTPISILSTYLYCPGTGVPVHYEGSQLVRECTPVTGLNNKCPEDSSCVRADGDVYGRQICCRMPLTTAVPTTVSRELVWETEGQRDGESQSQRRREAFSRITVSPRKPQAPYFIYNVTSRSPTFKIIQTKDPFCPSVIAGRECKPGNPLHCNEVSFFCQYNIVLEAFACCSMEVDGKQIIKA